MELDSPETFKVPALPLPLPPPKLATTTTTTTTDLAADIEHIIALGLNEPDPNQIIQTNNYEQVVKAMREKAGFGGMDETNQDLDTIANEMNQSGVTRRGEAVEEGMEIEAGQEEQVENQMKLLSSEASNSSESSDSNDSDEDIAAVLRPQASTSTTTSTQPLPKKRVRKSRGKKGGAESEGSGLSDDDENGTASMSAPKTAHEVDLPAIKLPELTTIPEDAEILPFGKISSVIDTVVVIKADTGGDWRVLDEGSLCCWKDRNVIGNIFETFGSVLSPFYSLRFPTSALPSPEVFTIGKQVYYAPHLSSFVFTRDLRKMKGSDASNLWDEEVGAAEMEWSDDEAEKEYKRNTKENRRARTASATPGPSSAPRATSVTASVAPSTSHALPPRPLVSYQGEEVYTPLQRPQNLHLSSDNPPPPPPPSIPNSHDRKMFERKVRARQQGGGGGEFEFSDNDDDEDETGSISSTFEVDERYREMDEAAAAEKLAMAMASSNHGQSKSERGRGGRGRGNRGTESGRGRGRGGSERGTSDRGRGRGGRGRGGGDRAVAPLPNRPGGLPNRPEGSVVFDDRRGSQIASSADEYTPQQSFPSHSNPTFYSPSDQHSSSQQGYNPSQPQSHQPSSQFNFNAMSQQQRQAQGGYYNPQHSQPPAFGYAYPPQYAHPSSQQQQQQQQQYQQSDPSRRHSESPYSPQPYSPLQQPPVIPSSGGGHFNPRFFGNQIPPSSASGATAAIPSYGYSPLQSQLSQPPGAQGYYNEQPPPPPPPQQQQPRFEFGYYPPPPPLSSSGPNQLPPPPASFKEEYR